MSKRLVSCELAKELVLESAVESALESEDTELSEDIRAWHSILMYKICIL